jgi:hypothetical protein
MASVLSDEQLEAAVRALSDPERFRGAERRLARIAPQLQRVLAHALEEGGWFEAAHGTEVAAAAAAADPAERELRIRTLLAEETRIGMLVGVAVGFELAREVDATRERRL